jgi:hypothetical protein
MRAIILLRVLMLLTAAFGTWEFAAENISLPKIAFSTEFEGGLYQLDPSSGKSSKIDVGKLDVGLLDYSPQIQVLAFEGSAAHEQPPSLYLLHLKGHKKECIHKVDPKSFRTFFINPKFDPKGEYLYAVNQMDGIYRYSLSEKNWKRVQVSGATKDLNPGGVTLSKSGRQAAISSANYNGLLIAKVEKDGFIIQKHVLNEFIHPCSAPQWIGDESIVFAGRTEPGLEYIWKLDLKSGEVTRITNPSVGTQGLLSLSKDEKGIVFRATAANELEWGLWLVSVDGTGLKQLTKGGEFGYRCPVWME